ncbi:SDR family oxidoreductase [Rhodococcus sp. Eu-32]|uniref:SDR family NAD(P)-dependent oxidoreductase n=1 Tax=Rhodococcus sp. Eu-32 TaxID=1017319 RepID=UPI000DF17B12|nr:SDR family oxidoreductase [Rhodococcus sp. Eu-32]RRQ26577.1 SDR family oxidoreductase [Rhodococcus sp. Eu-32]
MSRHAVVTGAASGIGLAIARRLLTDGWDVTLVDVRDGALAKAADILGHDHSTRVSAIVGDLADATFATEFVGNAWDIAPVDGLVNAAGIYPAIPFLDVDADAWNRVQAVNVVAPLLATQELARRAIATSTTPSVVNVASGAATRARPGTAHYSTSKAALVMLTKASAIELGPYGIRVNAVSPGFFAVDSEVNPVTAEYAELLSTTVLPGPAKTEYVADAVRFLLGEDARWVNGANVPVDGGSSAGTRSLPQHWDDRTHWQSGHFTTELSGIEQ